MTAPRERLLLDAPSLVYRAFFAVPSSLADRDGRPVNAVRGFVDMLARLVADRRPAAVVAAFDDDWRPAARVAAYPGYKAQRADDPPELPPQFPLVERVLDAAGIPRATSPGLEADDALATLVAAPRRGERTVVVTGDRDLVALVRDPDVAVLFTVRGTSQLDELDEAAVRERYGVPPQLYADFAMLRGDPSDGLPGVAGIGPVRAARLVTRFGSVDAILDNLGELPAGQATALDAARDYLAAMARVVPMVRDAPVETTASGGPDADRLHALAERHNLGGPVRRLLDALDAAR
ncbi:MAG TPA: 5'-3' exonuclease [Actinomycetota bacterium]|nr:5'-3' exonuclease [Actinomycetota bacterium]